MKNLAKEAKRRSRDSTQARGLPKFLSHECFKCFAEPTVEEPHRETTITAAANARGGEKVSNYMLEPSRKSAWLCARSCCVNMLVYQPPTVCVSVCVSHLCSLCYWAKVPRLRRRRDKWCLALARPANQGIRGAQDPRKKKKQQKNKKYAKITNV